MKLLYFAWLRERIGISEENMSLPEGITTASDLIEHLCSRSEGYQAAFEDLSLIRVAIDQEHADLGQSVVGASEIAFFPPVTGG